MPDPYVPLYQDIRWIVATILGLWGAGLSTYQQIVKRREQKPAIVMSISRSLMALDGSQRPEPHIGFHVRNTGFVDVFFKTLSSHIQVKGWEQRYVLVKALSSVEFPTVLKRGDSFGMCASLPKLQVELRKAGKTGTVEVRGCLEDALMRQFYSRWETIDV